MGLPRTMNTGGFVTSRKWGFIEIKILKNWMKARAPRDGKPGFHLEYGPTATSMAGRPSLQCVACVIPWKMVFRNTGVQVGTQLQPVSPDTSLFERRLPGRLLTVDEVPTARGTRRAVGAYLHTQPMPWVAARAFLVRGRRDGSPCVPYGAVLEV